MGDEDRGFADFVSAEQVGPAAPGRAALLRAVPWISAVLAWIGAVLALAACDGVEQAYPAIGWGAR